MFLNLGTVKKKLYIHYKILIMTEISFDKKAIGIGYSSGNWTTSHIMM